MMAPFGCVEGADQDDPAGGRRRSPTDVDNRGDSAWARDRTRKHPRDGLSVARSDDGQCRTTENLIREIPYGAGKSDKACCRGAGATCGRNLHCCTGEAGGREFQCVNGACQPFVEP